MSAQSCSCHVLLFFLQLHCEKLSDANLFILWRCFLIIPCHYLKCDGLRPKPAPILRDHLRLRSLASPFTPTNTPKRVYLCHFTPPRYTVCMQRRHVRTRVQVHANTHAHGKQMDVYKKDVHMNMDSVGLQYVCVRARGRADVTSVAVSHETSDHEN